MLQFDENSGIMSQLTFDSLTKESDLDVTIHLVSHLKEKGCAWKDMDNIDIFDAAKYIVCLYYKVDKPYTCSRTKIEKLLAIADLVFIKYSKRLFPKWPIYINSCGIGYRVLPTDSLLFPIDNIKTGNSCTEFSDKLTINLDNERDIPSMYAIDFPEGNERKVLEEVFCRFGACTAKLIGSAIDEFKIYIQSDMVSDSGLKDKVDVEKATEFFTHDNGLLKTNAIAKFIAEYTLAL